MKCLFPICDVEAHSFAFLPSTKDARMYVLLCRGEALVVDPNRSKAAINLLKQRGIKQLTILLTHEHYDHTCGINLLREHFSCTVVCSVGCAERICDSRKNLSYYCSAISEAERCRMSDNDQNELTPFSAEADRTFTGVMTLPFAGHSLVLTETFGHSRGSLCALMDGKVLFSGDSLVMGVPVVTRLPGGSIKEFQRITLPYLQALPADTWVMPGHHDAGELSVLLQSRGEWKNANQQDPRN